MPAMATRPAPAALTATRGMPRWTPTASWCWRPPPPPGMSATRRPRPGCWLSWSTRSKATRWHRPQPWLLATAPKCPRPPSMATAPMAAGRCWPACTPPASTRGSRSKPRSHPKGTSPKTSSRLTLPRAPSPAPHSAPPRSSTTPIHATVTTARPASAPPARPACWPAGAPARRLAAPSPSPPTSTSWPLPAPARPTPTWPPTTARPDLRWSESLPTWSAAATAAAGCGCVALPRSPPTSTCWLPRSTWPGWASSACTGPHRMAGRQHEPSGAPATNSRAPPRPAPTRPAATASSDPCSRQHARPLHTPDHNDPFHTSHLGRPSPAAESGQRGRPGRPTRGADAANALPAGPWLHVEADVEDVAFADDVGLALGAQQPLALGGVPSAGGDQLVVADHLGPDEATLQVGVDAAGSLRGGRAPADLPGPALVLAGGQERHQIEQPPGGADHLVQPAPLDAVLGQQGGRLAGRQLGRLGLQRGGKGDRRHAERRLGRRRPLRRLARRRLAQVEHGERRLQGEGREVAQHPALLRLPRGRPKRRARIQQAAGPVQGGRLLRGPLHAGGGLLGRLLGPAADRLEVGDGQLEGQLGGRLGHAAQRSARQVLAVEGGEDHGEGVGLAQRAQRLRRQPAAGPARRHPGHVHEPGTS